MGLLTFLVLITIFLIVLVFIDWLTHLSMTKESVTYAGWAGYRKFKKHFNEVDWEWDNNYKYSLFSMKYRINEYHANSIIFNNNGMLIHNPISYILVKMYVHRYIKKHFRPKKSKPKKIKVKW